MGRSLIAMLAVALTTAACATEAPGSPVPGTGAAGTPPSTSESRIGKAPPINSPELDLASYESRVCDLLGMAQLAPFAIREPGNAQVHAAGPVCTWKPPDTSTGTRVTVAILSKAPNGWEGVYDRRGNFPFFEEAGEIKGYPAVHIEATSDGTEGLCATVVGARRDLVYETGVDVYDRSSPEYKDACSVSDRVAGLVIDTLRGGR